MTTSLARRAGAALAVALGGCTAVALSSGCASTATSAHAFATPIGVSAPPRTLETPLGQAPGLVRELRMLAVTLADGSSVRLETLITRPSGPGPFPLVLVNHGSPPGGAAGRAAQSPLRMSSQSIAFARRGYAVAAVDRRGYGASDGDDVEWSGPCNDRDYDRAGRVSADDVLAAVRALRREPWVDPTKLLLVGHSAGGFAALAAAEAKPAGLLGVVSFAGGRGSDQRDHVCQADRLVSAMAELGRHVRVPSVWIYSANDHIFVPELARRMAEAYMAGGAPLQFVGVPAFGDDGHMLFTRAGTAGWWPLIEPFLTKIGLPTAVTYPVDVAALRPPRGLGKSGREAFAAYLADDNFEKAFAYGTKSWGTAGSKRTAGEAAEHAVKACNERGAGCLVYAINNEYAPGMADNAEPLPIPVTSPSPPVVQPQPEPTTVPAP